MVLAFSQKNMAVFAKFLALWEDVCYNKKGYRHLKRRK